MENEKLLLAVRKLVEQVTATYGRTERELTVNDLRLGIRNIRMSEISDWSNAELDAVEVCVSRFDGDVAVEQAMQPSFVGPPVTADAVTSICSPSPYAWT